MTCSDFVSASKADQRDALASMQGNRMGSGTTGSGASGSAATGGAAAAESNVGINSGADVSTGTRGVDNQSGTAALTAEGTQNGEPAGQMHKSVSVEDVVEACQSSPKSRVSEVVDQQTSTQ